MRNIAYNPGARLTLYPTEPRPLGGVSQAKRLAWPQRPGRKLLIRCTWWEAGFLNAADVSVVQRSQAASPALEALKSTKLTLSLARQGRQAAVELALTLVNFEGEASHPVTLFTGSWVAHLLGYPRKYRGARLIETFLGSAVRSYLLLYHFVPFCLRVRGAFFNFNSF